MTKLKILIPTNFNPQSEIALKQGLYFAEKNSADVILLHVIEGNLSKDNHDFVESEKKLKEIIKKQNINKGIKLTGKTASGKVIPEIIRTTNLIKPEFLLIGTEADSKPFKSTSLSLIEEIDCPVIILNQKTLQRGCQSIVLPLDLSKETTQKLEHAISFARAYNSTIHVISATNIKDEIKIELLRKKILHVKNSILKAGIKCESELFVTGGNKEVMANQINDYADDIKAGLIVIMTRQENRIEKLFIGSMASILIKKSRVPVLCVSPKS